MSEATRANEGGKSEFLRVRRVRDLDILPQKERKPRLKKTIVYFSPPKTALFGERTLSGTTVPHGAQRRRKGVDFHGKGEPRFRATRREKRGKQQRSVSGFPLKQAKNEKADAACLAPALFLFVFHLNQARQNHTFASVTSKMCRAHFPNECDLSRERGRKE